MVSSLKRKMSSTNDEAKEESDTVAPTKLVKVQDDVSQPSHHLDETSTIIEDHSSISKTSLLFIIDKEPMGHNEEQLSTESPVIGLKSTHTTADMKPPSNGQRNASIVAHLKGVQGVEAGLSTAQSFASMRPGSKEIVPITSSAQENTGTVDFSENLTDFNAPILTQQVTKASKSKENFMNSKSEVPIPTIQNSFKQQPSNPSPNSTDKTLEEKEHLDTLFVGRVIGKGGEMIRDLQARSGCRIDVDQNVAPGQPRIITYRGSRKTIDFAKHLVNLLCSDTAKMGDMDLPLGEAKQKVIAVPSSAIGRLIGRGGEMIRELQNRSHAKIQVDHSNTHPDRNVKLITVTGSDLNIDKAEELILCIVENSTVDAMTALNTFTEEKHISGSNGTQPVSSYPPHMIMHHPGPVVSAPSQQYHPGVPVDISNRGGQSVYPPAYGYITPNSIPASSFPVPQHHGLGIEREIFPCSKMCMGRIIGRKGVTVNDIQKRSGCDIQINQDVPPGRDCEVTILGTRPAIENAKRMLMDIIQLGSRHPYAGGEGAAAGTALAVNQRMIQPQGMYQPATGGVYMPTQYTPQPSFAYPVYAPMQYPQYPSYVGVSSMVNTSSNQPVIWKSALASDGQPYYYNDKGETTWDKPPGFLF